MKIASLMNGLPFCALVVSPSFISASSSLAATLAVPASYPTIQDGVDAATIGDTVLVAPGIYTHFKTRDTHAACVFLKNGVAIVSEGGPDATTIDGVDLVGPQPAVVDGGGLSSPLTKIDGFTITNHDREFNGMTVFGKLTVQECKFVDLSYLNSSGAGMNGFGDIIVRDCAFQDCRASIGGAIYHTNGALELYGCTFLRCGEAAVYSIGNHGVPLESAWIEDCWFDDCDDGGALATAYSSSNSMTVLNCIFRDNREESGGGGAIGNGGNGPKLIEGCLFLRNEVATYGGALDVRGPATIRNNTFWRSAAPTDAGGSVMQLGGGGAIELTDNIIAESIGPGGAIFAYQATVTSSCNVFWQNEGGDGVWFDMGPTDREVDPLFCDPNSEDFTLNTDSPCLPENSLGCGLIGAFGQGCGALSVDPPLGASSWGKIKGLYRMPEEDLR